MVRKLGRCEGWAGGEAPEGRGLASRKQYEKNCADKIKRHVDTNKARGFNIAEV